MLTIPNSVSSKIQIDPVVCYDGHVPEWALRLDVAHPFYTFWSIESGVVTLDWRGGSRRIAAGESVLIPFGFKRLHQFQAGSKMVSLSFCASWDDGRPVLSFREPLVAGSESSGKLRKAAKATAKCLGNPMSSLGAAQLPPDQWIRFNGTLDLAVAQILAWAHEQGAIWNLPVVDDLRLNKILLELAANPTSGPLPYARWRREIGLSRVHLDRLAIAHLGETIRERRDALLLGEIRKSITQRKESFKELAARLEFFDAPHFTQWTKRHAGKVPSRLKEIWS